ncbi:UreD urease accessory protein-domain-containing protein [Tricharina praecox]|uniref:UreD urease accessory protein-domain-containing protein n=1 Tax=Tricharina praecox TaxID=43433 RepID=UPI00221F5A26|nr:UreD urease accessory protein-domain-containing protein [Tricharina praecox]KAI5841997.1 UreD urease accessory protein-domain-containing protein [Tricharina praecox]
MSSAPGHGVICARLLLPARLVLPSLSFQYPLKLISSSVPSSKCLTVFILSYGGGLVSNDKIDLRITVEEAAKLCLLTQGHTKVFKQKDPSDRTTQTLTCTLEPRSSLLLLPDPIQPFAASNYKQHQLFHLPADDTASLIVLDWVTEGRSARGEHWNLSSFISRNEFFSPPKGEGLAPRLLLRDSMVLTGDGEAGRLLERMESQTVFATVMIHGPLFVKLEEAVLEKFRDEPRIGGRNFDNRGDFKKDDERKGGVVWTAARVRGFVLVKVTGRELEEVKVFIRGLLLLGGGTDGDGEVVRKFGEGALLCLQ